MNKRFIFSLSAMTTAMILTTFITSATVQSADEAKKGQIKLALNSVFFVTPIKIGNGKYRQVSLTGVLKETSGTGSLKLDINTCRLNQFGDKTACTKIGVFPYEVKFQRLRIDDPQKQKRRLYSITGKGLPKNLFLVVPSSAAGPYRFISSSDKNTTQAVITLEPSK